MLSRSIKVAANERETRQPALALNSIFVAARELLISLRRLAVIANFCGAISTRRLPLLRAALN